MMSVLRGAVHGRGLVLSEILGKMVAAACKAQQDQLSSRSDVDQE